MENTIPFNQIELRSAIQDSSQLLKIPAEQEVIRFGQYIKVIPIVLQGAIDVYRRDESGQELFLYSIQPSESCAMTLQCCHSNQPSEIYAKTAIDTEILAIPSSLMETWMSEFPEWKQFVVNSFSKRFNELLKTIDSIAFHQLDERLLEYLMKKKRTTGSSMLHISHQSIANDLNSSREAISRLLKQLEQGAKLKLGRNKIELM